VKLLLDTNIFLELILEQQKAQEARNLLSKADKYEFFVTDFSIHSIGLLLFRETQHQVFLEFLNDVLIEGNTSIIKLNVEDLKKVVSVSKHFTLDFDDAYQYVAAEKYNLTIVSFDADFDRCEKGRKTPIEILKEQI
jgi:predicted nucleic acid-binding protein